MKISRRETLARGGQAIAVVAAFPVVASVAASSAEGDAHLEALDREYWKRSEEQNRAREDSDRASFAASEENPDAFGPVSGCLLEACPSGIDADYAEIQAYYKGVLYPSNPAYADQEARKIHTHLSRHRAQIRGLWERHDCFAKLRRAKEADARESKAFRRLMETPAQTPSGVLIKLRVVYLEDERREMAEEAADPENRNMEPIVFTSIFAHLERLAGRA